MVNYSVVLHEQKKIKDISG